MTTVAILYNDEDYYATSIIGVFVSAEAAQAVGVDWLNERHRDRTASRPAALGGDWDKYNGDHWPLFIIEHEVTGAEPEVVPRSDLARAEETSMYWFEACKLLERTRRALKELLDAIDDNVKSHVFPDGVSFARYFEAEKGARAALTSAREGAVRPSERGNGGAA
jgi:hypothetical protein